MTTPHRFGAGTAGQGEVRRQHVVTRAVLARFAADDGLVLCIDLRSGRLRRTGPGAVGWRAFFIRHDSAGAELRWKTVEDPLPELFRSVDADAPLANWRCQPCGAPS